jgi:REP element-mobilizing transposase RayT
MWQSTSMTYARAHLVDTYNGGFYHCISRCVRRGWLCGEDSVSGHSYEHRRAWVEARILLLAEIFAVEVFGYAVMSNHYHLVLEVEPRRVAVWSDEEVVQRWLRLSPTQNAGPDDTRAFTILLDAKRVSRIRERLGSLSWFMRYLNEPIARQANCEDGCSGRFWEGRFKSIALLDDAAIVACMAYVDMNPIRAKIAKCVEDATHTSVQRRIIQPDESSTGLGSLSRVGVSLSDYVEMVRWTIAINDGDVSAPCEQAMRTLTRLNQSADGWLGQVNVNRFKYRAYGSARILKQYAQTLGQQWIKTGTHLHHTT